METYQKENIKLLDACALERSLVVPWTGQFGGLPSEILFFVFNLPF